MSEKIIPLFPGARADAVPGAGLNERPPMDIAAEQALLGAFMITGGTDLYRRVAEFLLPEHFYYPVHGRIFETIGLLVAAGTPLDPVIVKDAVGDEPVLALHGGTAAYITMLTGTAIGPTIALVYARTIANEGQLRSVIDRVKATIGTASSPGARIDDIVARLHADLAAHTTLHSGLGEWDASLDLGPIPPRGWLLGNTFCRGFVSSLMADGGVGKTAVRLAQLLSLAIGRPLTAEHVFQRCRVLIVSLEDNTQELRRRVRAAMLHHRVHDDEVRGWLFLAAPGRDAGKLAISHMGAPSVGPLLAKITAAIRRHKIDVVCIDPFVKAHSIEENSNDAMDFVVGLLSQLAIDHDCAIDAPHHISKGPADPGNANRGRGAGAFKDGGRLVYTLAPMSVDEAKLFNISADERRFLVRIDSGKVNIAPAAKDATWFRLVGVPLGNGTALYPHGDEVQTVERWEPPDYWAQLPAGLTNDILNRIDAGCGEGRRYSPAPQAKERAAWPVIVAAAPGINETQAKQVIGTWIKNDVLRKQPYPDPKERRDVEGLYVNTAKRPG